MTERDRSRLNKYIKKAGQVTGRKQNDFDEDYLKRLTALARRRENDETHPLALELSQRRTERSGRLRVSRSTGQDAIGTHSSHKQ